MDLGNADWRTTADEACGLTFTKAPIAVGMWGKRFTKPSALPPARHTSDPALANQEPTGERQIWQSAPRRDDLLQRHMGRAISGNAFCNFASPSFR